MGISCGWGWEMQTAIAGSVEANMSECFLEWSKACTCISWFLKDQDNDKECVIPNIYAILFFLRVVSKRMWGEFNNNNKNPNDPIKK